MTTKVTKESLSEKIHRLEGIKRSLGDLSISEEYQLEAYSMLLAMLQPVELPDGFSVGDNEDDPSYFNDWCYLADGVKEALTRHGLEFVE